MAAEAIPIIDECLKRSAGKVAHPQLVALLLDSRLRHFEKSKDAAGCRETTTMWENLKRTDFGSLYDAACFRAVTAAVVKEDAKTPKSELNRLSKEEADQAMAWLKEAIVKGYKDTTHIAEDKDLECLRDRADFKKPHCRARGSKKNGQEAAAAGVQESLLTNRQ